MWLHDSEATRYALQISNEECQVSQKKPYNTSIHISLNGGTKNKVSFKVICNPFTKNTNSKKYQYQYNFTMLIACDVYYTLYLKYKVKRKKI